MNASDPADRRPLLVAVVLAYALVMALVLLRSATDDKGLVFAIGAVATVSFAVAVAVSPYYGLLVFLVLYFVRPFERFEVLAGARIMYYVGVLTIGFAVAQYMVERRPTLVRHPVHLALTAYLAAYCWSALQWGIDDWLIPCFQNVILIPLLCYGLLVTLVRSPAQHRILAWVIVLSVGYIAISATQSQDVEAGERVKSYGHFADPNDLAMMLVALMPLSFALFNSERGVMRRTIPVVVVAVALYVIWLTDSRGGLIGLVGLSGVVLIDHIPDRRVLVPVLLVFGMVGLAFLNFGFGRRGAGVAESASTGSGYGRRSTWQAAINMCKDKPLTGVGPHKFRDFQRDYFPSWGDYDYQMTEAHSFFFQVVGELGLPGVAALLYLLWRFGIVAPASIRRYLRLLEPTRSMWHLGRALRNVFWGWLFCAFFLTQAYKFLLFLIIALIVSFDNMLKEQYEAKYGPVIAGAFDLRPFPADVAPMVPSGGGGAS